MSNTSPAKGSLIRNWLWIPVAAICLFLIYWGVWGTHWVVVEPALDNSSNKTGTISEYDVAELAFNLTTEKGDKYAVTFKDNANLLVIEEKDGAKAKATYKYSDNVDLVKDGIKVTATGKIGKDMTIKAQVLHIGGAENIPELIQNLENDYIYGTADKLCIACVGLGDSDLNRLWQMGLILLGFLIVYFAIYIYSRRRGAA
jgi:hypothetical protein